MRHVLFLMFALLSFVATSVRSESSLLDNMLEESGLNRGFDHDADLARYANLVYWSGLIEKYHEIHGTYPLSEVLDDGTIGLVRIATQDHAQYYLHNAPFYDAGFDFNAQGRFQNIHVISLIRLLNQDLDEVVLERYDIQKVPVKFPTWLHYFVMPNGGYLLWTACALCEASNITYPIEDEFTYQTLNIGSPEFAATNPAFFTREDMLNHPVFKALITQQPIKPGFILFRLEGNQTHWQDIFAAQENAD